jgi:RNA polymerase-binding transcription factor
VSVDVDRARERLLEERTRVTAEIQELRGDLGRSLEDETDADGSVSHLADVATETLDREMDVSLEENAEQLLGHIDAALARVDAGTYGTCERCGKPIDDERLEALPWATLCIEDKRREERG